VTRSTNPAPVIGNVEVPSVGPTKTPEIVIDPSVADDERLDVTEPSASVSSWIFGFIVGLVVGGFIGRASWNVRRRRGQRVFG
jgi:membrane associated rhomboid family serine protease